jgi:CRP-like cAMP-binding protein
MHLEESKRILQRSDLFAGLKDMYLNIILMVCEEISYLAGDMIFREGDPGDALYLVARGAVEVVLEPRSADEASIPVAVLGPNSTFGEVTLVEQESRRTASVRCQSDTQLIRIDREKLLRVCCNYPEIGFQVMRRIAGELAAKLRTSNLSIRQSHLFAKPLEDPDSEAGA